LKYQATGTDSIKILELEKQLTDEEITKRIVLAFNELFSKQEIEDIYKFIQTTAFEKTFMSGETYNAISSQFNEINQEIKKIKDNLDDPIEIAVKEFKPIPVDKENGFYATIGYTHQTADADVKLEEKPSLTSNDILEIKKVYSNYNNKPEISIVFTKKGAKKFYILTKENIGNPVAIVIAKHIVSMPTVNSEIIGGKANISGDFTDEEIDKMIEILKNK
jgi:preprotein translocase subunit SecD